MNLRSYTLDRLSKVSLDGKASGINMVIPTRHTNGIDGSHSGDNTYQAYKLDNGINVFLSPDTQKFQLEVIDTDGVVHDASKWFNYSNFFRLESIMSMAQEVARDIDLAIFSVVKDVFFAMVDANLKLHDTLFTDGIEFLGFITYNNTNHGLHYVRVGNYSGGTHYTLNTQRLFSQHDTNLYLGDFESVIQSAKSYDGLREWALDTDTNSYPFYKLASRLFNNLVIDIVEDEFKPSTLDINAVLDEKPDFILFDGYGDTKLEIPLSFLDKHGVEYGFCVYSKQAVLTKPNSRFGRALPQNAVGTYFPRLDDIVLSNVALDYNVSEEYCDECGDSHDAINADFVNDVLASIDDAHTRNTLSRLIENRYDVSEGYVYTCSSCVQRQERINRDLAVAGVSYSGSTFTLKDRHMTYHMSSGSGIHDYNYKPDFELYHLDDESDIDLHLGAEIEVDQGGEDSMASRVITAIMNEDIADEYTYSMHDGSIGDGFEIATQPSTLLFHMEEVNYQDAFRVASALGYRAHDTSSCGLHVHMSRRFFGSSRATQNIKAAFMALILERNWSDVVKFSRRNYHHLEEWADKKNLTDYVYDTDTADDIASKFLDSYEDKYVALNTQHRNSFELRIFRGTLRYETYIATLQFVSNLAHIAKACTTLTRAQQISFDDIVNFKHYTELNNYLKTRGMFVESDTTPVMDTQPTLFDVATQ